MGTLSEHLKTVHGKAKAFKCDACLKEFSRRGYLNIHLNTVHGKAKGFRCDAYLKGFCQKGHLSRHPKTAAVGKITRKIEFSKMFLSSLGMFILR